MKITIKLEKHLPQVVTLNMSMIKETVSSKKRNTTQMVASLLINMPIITTINSYQRSTPTEIRRFMFMIH